MKKNKNLENYLFKEMEREFNRNQRKKVSSKKDKGWFVKNDRPEEYLGDPFLYYSDEEVEKYARSGGMRRAQEKIAYRVLELLELEPGKSLLDIGSGPGYTAEVYRSAGYNVVCMDLIPKMIEKAKEKGFEAYVGDMRDIKELFNGRKFDGVVSVSALQWIKDKNDIKKVAQGIYSVLNEGGPLIIQFYPKSEKELKEIARIFTNNGFYGEIIIDWPDIPKKRTIYLVMKRY
ncbi:MAG: methyltransferase domain-containing protein [Candidatus Pacearchaeota archaeon]